MGRSRTPDLAATRARLECAAMLLPEPVHPALFAILAVSVATAEESADRDVVQQLEHALVVGAAILADAYSSKNYASSSGYCCGGRGGGRGGSCGPAAARGRRSSAVRSRFWLQPSSTKLQAT